MKNNKYEKNNKYIKQEESEISFKNKISSMLKVYLTCNNKSFLNTISVSCRRF